MPFRGPSPVRQRKQRQEDGQRLWQGDIYLPGSAGTQLAYQPSYTRADPQACREEGRTATGVPSEGRDQCGCLPKLWWGLTKGTCQEPPSGNWGALFHFLIPGNANQHSSEAPGPLSLSADRRGNGSQTWGEGGSSSFIFELGEQKFAPVKGKPPNQTIGHCHAAGPLGWRRP